MQEEYYILYILPKEKKIKINLNEINLYLVL